MKKLPTVKIGGKTAFVIDRTHIEDDIAAAEAISRDAARWRWLRDNAEFELLDALVGLAPAEFEARVDAAMK